MQRFPPGVSYCGIGVEKRRAGFKFNGNNRKIMNNSITFKRYGVKEYIRGWHIILDGEIVWDGAGYGDDKPLMFDNEDAAMACAARMSDAMEENQ